ncbi:predicted protein [Histoplasma mississippiense (nom. inval.)]|uniref:predicted protein n=1 Tax=Ajellomyces capsulatus (strain NAm1 / WU24) TaxID=2059318 RepID=UPI000157B2B2|nr:predicted protein [Histoplasma mississippiense (nom. inval.)]EDN02283.1 predicted protein [Histoplasma mississippiense (nom. inval.)]
MPPKHEQKPSTREGLLRYKGKLTGTRTNNGEYTKPKTGMKRKEVGDVFLSREEENARQENRENVKREKEQQAGKQERNHFKEGNIV